MKNTNPHLFEPAKPEDLEQIQQKLLSDITNEDLLKLGLLKARHHPIYDPLYSFENPSGAGDLYITRIGDEFELRGFRLRLEKKINSTKELLSEIGYR